MEHTIYLTIHVKWQKANRTNHQKNSNIYSVWCYWVAFFVLLTVLRSMHCYYFITIFELYLFNLFTFFLKENIFISICGRKQKKIVFDLFHILIQANLIEGQTFFFNFRKIKTIAQRITDTIGFYLNLISFFCVEKTFRKNYTSAFTQKKFDLYQLYTHAVINHSWKKIATQKNL